MELNDIFAQPEVIQALATVFAVGVSVAVLYVVGMWSIAKGAQYYRVIRGAKADIRAMVDEPTDAANIAIDRVLDRFYKAQWENMAAVFLPKFIDGMTKILDAKLYAPPQEVNLSEATPTGELDKAA